MCVWVCVCNVGLASLASCCLNCVSAFKKYCFPCEVSQHGCSLYVNFVQCTELYFNIRGSCFINILRIMIRIYCVVVI